MLRIPDKSTAKYSQEIVKDLTRMGVNEDMSVAAAQRTNSTDAALEWINQRTKQRVLLPLLPGELEHIPVNAGGGMGMVGRSEPRLGDDLLKKIGHVV